MNHPPKSRLSLFFLLAGVFLVALALRSGLLLSTADDPYFQVLQLDSYEFQVKAQTMLQGHWLPDRLLPHGPSYSWFMAAVYRCTGPNPESIRWVQSVIGSLGCSATGLLGYWLLGPWGIVAGLILAASPSAILFDSLLLMTSLLLSLFAAMLLIATSWMDPSRSRSRAVWWWALPCGALMGAATGLRPQALLLIPAMLILALWPNRSAGPVRWKGALFFLLGSVLLLGPLYLWAGLCTGEWGVYQTNAGYNVYLGNSPERTGTASVRDGYQWNSLHRETWVQEFDQTSERDRYWLQKTADEVLGAPGKWLALLGRKVLMTIQSREIGATYDIGELIRRSALLKSLPFRFGLFFPLALFGLLALLTNARARPLILTIFLYGASVVITVAASRYRHPLLIGLAIGAVAGIRQLIVWGRSKQWGRLGVVGVIIAASGLLLHLDFRPAGSLDVVRSEYQLGQASLREKDPQKALDWFDRAIEIRPGDPDNYVGKGNAYQMLGNYEKAVQSLEKALSLAPDFSKTNFMLGNLHLSKKNYEAAIKAFDDLLRYAPAYSEAVALKGKALMELGRLEEAETVLRKATEMRIDFRKAIIDLGLCLMKQERWAEAEQTFRPLRKFNDLSPAVFGYMATTYVRMGNFDAARKILSECRRRFPKNARLIKEIEKLIESNQTD
ncbi:MAG: tetratricopeptide repeat protein [Planctomycetes bacterium]|nr:tetratricopeptide repeat protein [Planctomycetota bacterium]